MKMHAFVYKTPRKAETYLYIPRRDDFSEIPAALLQALGELEMIMELELHTGRKLARADAQEVIRHLQEQGYYLQLPPSDPLSQPQE